MPRLALVVAVALLSAAGAAPGSAAPSLSLRTLPGRVFLEPTGDGFERWAFRLVATVENAGDLVLESADLEVFAGASVLRSEHYDGRYLDALRGEPLPSFADVASTLNLLHRGAEPVPSHVDRLRYTLVGRAGGESVRASLDVPLERYVPRTALGFPLRGRFVVVAGHDPGEAHALERSEAFAYDVANVSAGGGLTATVRARRDSDFVTFGMPVYAPADGLVVRARGDLPDNRPGEVPSEGFYRAIADREQRLAAVAGNVVVIDHGGGEFSLLGHLQRGSVRVRPGERVVRGQLLGRVGNSGNSTAPHLHYHLMAGPLLFRSDGLPAVFTNVVPEGPLERGVVYAVR